MYTLASRNSSVESNVDELENKAGSMNAVLSGTTTSNGLALLNGAVSFGSTISGIDVADVSSFQGALDTKAPLASPTFSGTVQGITKSMVGLGNVDNTSDADKPVSTAIPTALDAKADKMITYTKTDVDTQISNLIGAAPEVLNTLNELAAALSNDANYAKKRSNPTRIKGSASKPDLYWHRKRHHQVHGRARQRR